MDRRSLTKGRRKWIFNLALATFFLLCSTNLGRGAPRISLASSPSTLISVSISDYDPEVGDKIAIQANIWTSNYSGNISEAIFTVYSKTDGGWSKIMENTGNKIKPLDSKNDVASFWNSSEVTLEAGDYKANVYAKSNFGVSNRSKNYTFTASQPPTGGECGPGQTIIKTEGLETDDSGNCRGKERIPRTNPKYGDEDSQNTWASDYKDSGAILEWDFDKGCDGFESCWCKLWVCYCVDYFQWKHYCCPDYFALPYKMGDTGDNKDVECMKKPEPIRDICEAGESPDTGAGGWKGGEKCKRSESGLIHNNYFYCNSSYSEGGGALVPENSIWDDCSWHTGNYKNWFTTCTKEITRNFRFPAALHEKEWVHPAGPGYALEVMEKPKCNKVNNGVCEGNLRGSEFIANNVFPGSIIWRLGTKWLEVSCVDSYYHFLGKSKGHNIESKGKEIPTKGWITNPWSGTDRIINLGDGINVETRGLSYDTSREDKLTVKCEEGFWETTKEECTPGDEEQDCVKGDSKCDPYKYLGEKECNDNTFCEYKCKREKSELPIPAIIPGCLPKGGGAKDWESMTAGAFKFCEGSNCSGYNTFPSIWNYHGVVDWIPNVCTGTGNLYDDCKKKEYNLQAEVNSTCFYDEKKDGKTYVPPKHTKKVYDNEGGLLGICKSTYKDHNSGKYSNSSRVIRDCGNSGEGDGIVVNESRGTLARKVHCTNSGWGSGKYVEAKIKSAYVMNSRGYSCGYGGCETWKRDINETEHCKAFKTNGKCPGFDVNGDKVSVVVEVKNKGTAEIKNPFFLFANRSLDPFKDKYSTPDKMNEMMDIGEDELSDGKTGIWEVGFNKGKTGPRVSSLRWVAHPGKGEEILDCSTSDKCDIDIFNRTYLGFLYKNYGANFTGRTSNTKIIYESKKTDHVLQKGETMYTVLTMEASLWNKSDIQIFFWDWEANLYQENADLENRGEDDPREATPRSFLSRVYLRTSNTSTDKLLETAPKRKIGEVDFYNLSFNKVNLNPGYETEGGEKTIADDKLNITGNLNLTVDGENKTLDCEGCIQAFASEMTKDTFDVSWIRRESPVAPKTLESLESLNFYEKPKLKELNKWSGVVYIPRSRNLRMEGDLSMKKAGTDLKFTESKKFKQVIYPLEAKTEDKIKNEMSKFNSKLQKNLSYGKIGMEEINNTMDLRFLPKNPLSFRVQEERRQEPPSDFLVNITNKTTTIKETTGTTGEIRVNLKEGEYQVNVSTPAGGAAEHYLVSLWNADPSGQIFYKDEKHTSPEFSVSHLNQGLVPFSETVELSSNGEKLEKEENYTINYNTGEIKITGAGGSVNITYSSYIESEMLVSNITSASGETRLNFSCEECKGRFIKITTPPTVNYIKDQKVGIKLGENEISTTTTNKKGVANFSIPAQGLVPTYRAFLLNDDNRVIESLYGNNLFRIKCMENCSTPSGKNKTPTEFKAWTKREGSFNLSISKANVDIEGKSVYWKTINWSKDTAENGNLNFKANIWDEVGINDTIRVRVEALDSDFKHSFTSPIKGSTEGLPKYSKRKMTTTQSLLINHIEERGWGFRKKIRVNPDVDRKFLKIDVPSFGGDCESIRFFKHDPVKMIPSQSIGPETGNCEILVKESVKGGETETIWAYTGARDLSYHWRNWSKIDTSKGEVSNDQISVEFGECLEDSPCIKNISLKGSSNKIYGKGIGIQEGELANLEFSQGERGPVKNCLDINYKVKTETFLPREIEREICIYKNSTRILDEVRSLDRNYVFTDSGPGNWGLYFEDQKENLPGKRGGGQALGEYAFFYNTTEEKSVGIFFQDQKKFNYSYRKKTFAISDPYISDLYFSQNKNRINVPDYKLLSNLSEARQVYFSQIENWANGKIPYQAMGNAKYYSDTWIRSGTSWNCKDDNRKGYDSLGGETCGYGKLDYSLGLVRPGIHSIEFFTVGEKYSDSGEPPRIDMLDEEGGEATVVGLPKENLTNFWPLDEIEGEKVEDIRGESPGEVHGPKEAVKGLKFNGKGDHVSLPTTLSPELTLEAWVKTEDNATLMHVLSVDNFKMGVNDTRAYLNLSGEIITSESNITEGWNRLTATYDGNITRFYLDGLLVGQIERDDFNFNGKIRIGGEQDHYFNGSINKVKLYDRPLSGEEASEKRVIAAARCDVKNNSITNCVLKRDDRGEPLLPKRKGYVVSLVAHDDNESVDYSAESLNYYQAYVHPLKWDISYDLVVQPYIKNPVPIKIVEGKNKLEISFCGDGSCQPRLGENHTTCSQDCPGT